MQRLRLQQVPNQQFNITLDGVVYAITLRTVNRCGVEMTLCDVSVNGEAAISGYRCIPNMPLIPYEHLTVNGANFYFYCLNGDYPYYTQFNVTQVLCYGTKEELDALWQ